MVEGKGGKKVVNEATIERKKATKIFTCAKVIYDMGHKDSCKSLNRKEPCSLQKERLISTAIFTSLFLVFVLATYYMRNPSCSEIFWVDDSKQRLVHAKCANPGRNSPRNNTVCNGTKCLCVHRVELALCRPSGA
jgi:hypothetical protein